MSRILRLVPLVIVGTHLLAGAWADEARPHDDLITPIGLGEVRWTGGFWYDGFERCRSGSLPAMTRIMQGTDRSQFLHNFRIAAGLAEGPHRGPDWNDGDCYKWLEAMAAVYAVTGEAELDRELDAAIALIAQAQRADGYLHTPVLIKARALAQRHGDKGIEAAEARPLHNPQQFEMYNFGHLCTAACVHYRATGKRNLLDVAIRAADFLDRQFAQPDLELARHAICPAHYMGLIDLARVTGERRYVALVERWLAMRDLVAAAGGGDDNQDRLPFREQTEAVGHAVRANYLCAGIADLYLETGDRTLLPPLQRIWENMVERKLYITGGCGALYDGASPEGSPRQKQIARVHQAYGRDYQLPNSTAHNETCAAVGFVFWNWRMLQATGDARFADALETALYNAALAGISLDGQRYFYTNPLRQLHDFPTELRWSREREPFISCFCCPPNIVRLIAQVNGLAYGQSSGTLWVNLYGSNEVRAELAPGETVRLRQSTSYPWEGRIELTIDEAPSQSWTLACRIPTWARNLRASINDAETAQPPQAGSYLRLHRRWSRGDRVTLEWSQPPRLIQSHPLVEETRNHVAIQRGPLVYCLESSDLPAGTTIEQVALPRSMTLSPRFDADLLGGVTVLEGEAAIHAEPAWSKALYRDLPAADVQRKSVTFVPYFAWGNRGRSEMSVWLPLVGP